MASMGLLLLILFLIKAVIFLLFYRSYYFFKSLLNIMNAMIQGLWVILCISLEGVVCFVLTNN